MAELEQTLDSREVAEMIEKNHKDLIRDIRRYMKQFNESNIAPVDFFRESTYEDSKGETRPCYCITKKGCEFIAHKLTGTKGTIFTARYINRFHEMQDIISGQAAVQEPELPWFIRNFRGRRIILERDFIQITGVDITKHKLFYRMEYFTGGRDYNGYAWHSTIDKEKFKQEYGFDYGNDKCMMYFYPSGVRKALSILEKDRAVHMNPDAVKTLTDGMDMLCKPEKKRLEVQNTDIQLAAGIETKKIPGQITISIMLGDIPEVSIR